MITHHWLDSKLHYDSVSMPSNAEAWFLLVVKLSFSCLSITLVGGLSIALTLRDFLLLININLCNSFYFYCVGNNQGICHIITIEIIFLVESIRQMNTWHNVSGFNV